MLNKGYWFVNRLFVSPNCRGEGIGTKLIRLLVEQADALGVTLTLEINSYDGMGESDLLEFYKKFGFRGK
jgi:GNAT superfamily N-acetyltransferase